ncbi:MAG: DinB family protein [Chloroflexota bacterium]|nr:DinB family protein [Chloroflexota bacterium]
MPSSLLTDAFAHHAWATLRLLDVCESLTAEQLDTTVPGTYGSIMATLRHMVGADSWYLYRVSGERFEPISDEDEAVLDLAGMRALMETNGPRWQQLVAGPLDPDEMISVTREDGTYGAPIGIRLAQVLHHGTDHRSQICTALTSLGVEPPAIDLWDYGDAVGRTQES